MKIDVSVVLPVKNGGKYLAEVLDAVFTQETQYSFEVVAIDSGSTDGSLDILRSRPVRLLTIRPEQFNHGLTRNLAISKAEGRYIVLLTQDATPVGRSWLDSLVRPLEQESVAGAYARQIPRPDADPVTRHGLESWIAGSTTRRTHMLSLDEYAGLSPFERYLRCYFDNVCSAVKRSVWEKIPFTATYFAEDTEWGKSVLLAGYQTVYEPEATVIHSHDRSPQYEYRRTYLAHRRLFSLFLLRTIPTRRHLLRAFISECRSQTRLLRSHGVSLPRLLCVPANAFASTYGQYRGAASELAGRPLPSWPV